MGFSSGDEALLRRYVTNTDSNIYCIRGLPPEVVAVLFAYYSRSPATFRENLLKVISDKDIDVKPTAGAGSESQGFEAASEKARKFHERWVVAYGHGSVAEHAVASTAIEDVSILATKVIEDNRLASYTEKSTRYQVYDRTRYYKPANVMKSKLGKEYEQTANLLMDTYAKLYPEFVDFFKEKFPRGDKDEKAHAAQCHAKACDVVRYLLPTATLTNLGMTANARSLEHAIAKMLSNPLEEIRDMGAKVKAESQKLIPTLVKFADANKYTMDAEKSLEEMAPGLVPMKARGDKAVVLSDYDKKAEEKIAAALLYKHSQAAFADVLAAVEKMGEAKRRSVIDAALKGRGAYDLPLREFEHASYTFDILVDYGAFRDIQRHRICTQTNQKLTPEYGYSTPPEIAEAGFEKEYGECMRAAKEAYGKLEGEFPWEAQYILPLAFRKRALFTWNLRELHHFIRLRSAPQGHASYRRVAQEMHAELEKVQPFLASSIRVDKSDTGFHN